MCFVVEQVSSTGVAAENVTQSTPLSPVCTIKSSERVRNVLLFGVGTCRVVQGVDQVYGAGVWMVQSSQERGRDTTTHVNVAAGDCSRCPSVVVRRHEFEIFWEVHFDS